MDQLYFVIHTHWDREWYQPFQQMRTRLLKMTDRMLELLEKKRLPCFHFDGQTIVLEDYLEIRPEAERRIAKLVKSGVLRIGPWYLLADSFLPTGEALIRNLEIGMRLARRFGKSAVTGYLPDQFGHVAQLPQILAGFGIENAVLFRGVPREVKQNRFQWEALDGTSVRTVFLPFGYANGSNLPADALVPLLNRLDEIVAREREFADGAPILLMNGNDHADPDPRVYNLLKQVPSRRLGWKAGALDDYVRKIGALPRNGIARHRGELRSPSRSNLTPGVTSVRAWIKQRDFHNSYLLEKLAEPMLAIGEACGHTTRLSELADMAWRITIQNHPHDSICGCSVDQVHRDMRYRFDQAEMIAEDVIRGAAGAVFKSGAGGDPAIAVLNPGFARRALVQCETEVEDSNARYVAVDSAGRRHPAAIFSDRPARTLDIEVSAPDLKGLPIKDENPELMGWYLDRFELRPAAAGIYELNFSTRRSPSGNPRVQDFRRRVMEIPDDARVRIHATEVRRSQVSFVANSLAQAGISMFKLLRNDSPASDAPPISSDSVENEFFRVSAAPHGLIIDDLRRGKQTELYFEDDGDRGDEYNFDPVPGASAIAQPASIDFRILESGPVRQRSAATLVYQIPAALSEDRRARDSRTAEVRVNLTATLYAGMDRVDFDATVDNHARDHRFRAALATRVQAVESLSDTSFGMVRRSLEPTEPSGVYEDVYPTAPHRTFTAVESPELSVAMMARGIYETEVRRDTTGATILLSLLRCVGWMSRGDLAMRRVDAGPEIETPDAQELGQHRFEFAIAAWQGNYTKSEITEIANAYAYPPKVFLTRSGVDADSLWLCRCDNPRIAFSTARPLARGGGFIVRVYNASEAEEKARFIFNGKSIRAIDLAGRPAKDPKIVQRKEAVEVSLRPFQIATFEVRAAKLKPVKNAAK
ncbi:MAG TPA: glycoside hydrolase family 38 C-terminal domain-containing protein [Candidatus Binataceae bacterium]|nr:glycoside hydrolase family 38 C-terminal domain-containing protein [Candidatus Binataceae bacterium]